MTNTQQYIVALVSFLIIPLSGVGTDIYVPSLPAIATYFGESQTLAQLSVTVYIVTYGVFQLIAGPLSDRFGRRFNFILGTLIFAIASLLAAKSPSIDILLVMRFFQGIGISFTSSAVRAVFPDVYTGKRYDIMITYSSLAWAMGPIVSPAIGGYLQTYFGWEANFYALAIYGSLAFIAAYLMPETLKKKVPLSFSDAMRNYKILLSQKDFLGGLIVNLCIYSIISVFYVVGPFLIQSELGRTPLFYGHLALVLGLGWFTGNLLNRALIHVPFTKKFQYGLIANCFISMAMFIASLVFSMSVTQIFVPTFCLIIFGGIVFPNAYGYCMRLHPHMSGYASAAMGSLFVTGAGIMTTVAALLETNNETPLAITYVALTIIPLLAYYITMHNQPDKTHVDN